MSTADIVVTVLPPQHLSATSCQAEGRYGHWVYHETAPPSFPALVNDDDNDPFQLGILRLISCSSFLSAYRISRFDS